LPLLLQSAAERKTASILTHSFRPDATRSPTVRSAEYTYRFHENRPVTGSLWPNRKVLAGVTQLTWSDTSHVIWDGTTLYVEKDYDKLIASDPAGHQFDVSDTMPAKECFWITGS